MTSPHSVLFLASLETKTEWRWRESNPRPRLSFSERLHT